MVCGKLNVPVNKEETPVSQAVKPLTEVSNIVSEEGKFQAEVMTEMNRPNECFTPIKPLLKTQVSKSKKKDVKFKENLIYSDNQTSTPKNKQLEISRISVKEDSNVKNKDKAEIFKAESSINNTPKLSNKCRLSRVKQSLSFERGLSTSTCATLDILTNSNVNKSNI